MATPVSAFQPPPDEPPPPGRHPADAVAMRDRVYSQTMQAMQSLPPVSNGQFTLRLASPEYVDPPTFTPKQQKEAMLTGQTLGRRVKGTWELVDDASGAVVDSRRQIVARVPFFTDRGLVIHRGSNYAVGNQPRLEPGVFVRRRSNGEPDVHVATMPGQGIGHHYGLDAAKSIFTVRVGQSAAPLTPLLRILGATDEEMKEAWGEDLWKANATMQGDPAIRRVKKAFLRKVDATDDELRARIAETRLTPEISTRTLGQPHAVLNKDAILTATKRLLAMTKGEDEGDDRDDPSYQRVYGPEDMMAERLLKDSSGVRRRALYEATREGSLKRIPSGLLTSQLEHVLLKSGLGQSLEELNALEPLDKMTRATRLGEGGIPSTQSIPPESRDVRPSQFGFFDPVRTPECYDAQTQVMTRRGWLFRSELKDTDELACLIRGALQWRTADKHTHELYTGPMYRVESLDLSIAVTPDHRMYLRTGGEWVIEPAWQAFQREQFDVLVAGPNAGPEWQGRPLEAAHDETTGEAAVVSVRKRNVYVEQVNKLLVWCVRVPGNLLFVRRKSCQGFWCGNSLRVGVDNFFASGAIKGDDGQLYSRFRNARTGGMVYRSPRQLAGAAIAVPGAEKSRDSRILAIKNGRWDYLDRSEIDYLPGPYQDFYSPLANLVPLVSTEKAQRLAMGARMLTQAVPLVGAEAPLVRNAIPGTKGKRAYDEEYASYAGAVRAPQGGKVVAADADSIQVRYENGQEQTFDLYNNHPSNRKTYFHQQSLLKPGDTFKAGQAIAKSNYTDDSGAIAIGRNLRTAFLPFRGLNFEDAVVISESAAKKLTSEHAYQHGIDPDPSLKLGKAPYLGLFAAKYPRDKIDRMDDNGLIQPGHRVEYGDPLILAAKERAQDGSRIHKKGAQSYADATVTWDHEDPGVVTDVATSKNGPVVVVRALSASKIGDKLSGRHGNKAIISGIIPDAEMPRDPKGRPFEVLFGSEGVTTRANPAQKFEMWLGKIAEQTGKPVRVEDFDGTEDRADWVFRKLAAAGLTSRETVNDPDTGLDIPGVATGNMWVMKLGHMAEAKEQARGGGGYTADDTPSKGGYGGSKRLGLLNVAALMSHGAHELAREAGSIRGTRPEDFWNLFMRGENPREPGEPTVYRKFWDNLHAAGVRLYRQNHKVHLMGLTNDEVSQLADGRYITSPATVRAGSLDPVPGGLFDKALTGSHGGKQWAAVPLPEKMPSPVLEEPLRRLLNLTKDQFEGVLSGTHEIPGAGTGPQAFERAFSKFDIDREITSARANLNAKSAVTRDEASRRLGYLKGMAKYGRKPSDFLFDAMPVLPAAWRPINMLPSGTPMVSDSNYLYGDLVRAADNLKVAKSSLGDTNAGVERLAVYRAMKAVAGLGDPVGRKSQEKQVKGILQHVMGDSPKYSTLQRQLLSTPVDTVGRGVIIPDPALDMDQVGLPIDMAIDSYSRAVVRRMVRQGHSPVAAVKAVRDRTPGAIKALQDEMAERPVYMDRAPVLHKFGIMGAKPVLVPGRAVRISPLVVAPFNADFDGDTMQIHVPATDAAVSRVFEMLPSRNLFSPADFRKPNYAPGQQYQGGLYHASTAKKDKRPQTFATQQDVIRALQRGTLQADDPVTVLNVEE